MKQVQVGRGVRKDKINAECPHAWRWSSCPFQPYQGLKMLSECGNRCMKLLRCFTTPGVTSFLPALMSEVPISASQEISERTGEVRSVFSRAVILISTSRLSTSPFFLKEGVLGILRSRNDFLVAWGDTEDPFPEEGRGRGSKRERCISGCPCSGRIGWHLCLARLCSCNSLMISSREELLFSRGLAWFEEPSSWRNGVFNIDNVCTGARPLAVVALSPRPLSTLWKYECAGGRGWLFWGV